MGPGPAGDPLENQESAKDFQCWPSSVELGRARPAVKMLNIRTRPASAEVSRAQASSAGVSRACRRSRGPRNVIFFAPDGQKMSSSIFMIWNSLVTIPLELDTDLHSPHSNGNFERQDFGEGLEALSSSGPQKVVFWGPGLAGDPLENQENTKDFDCWPSSVELGRARPAVKILNIRARPASAELGRPAGRWLGKPAESQPEAGAQKSRFPALPSPPDPRAPWMSFLVHTFQRRSNRTTSFVLEVSDGVLEKLFLNVLH